MMRYLAWRSRAGTSGSGGDDLAEAPPRLPNVTPAWHGSYRLGSYQPGAGQ